MDIDTKQQHPSNHELLSFLEQTIQTFSTLTKEERWCILQFYSKMHMLKNKQFVEEDDFDYISFGLLIKSLVKTTNNPS